MHTRKANLFLKARLQHLYTILRSRMQIHFEEQNHMRVYACTRVIYVYAYQ